MSGISFDQKDGVNIMKGYMESGEFSRGGKSIRAERSIVMVRNFEVDVQHQQRVGHLFGPLPPEMRNLLTSRFSMAQRATLKDAHDQEIATKVHCILGRE